MLTEIKNRSVADVCILVCDGLTGLPDAVTTVWPRTIVQLCVVHYADVRIMPTSVGDPLWLGDFWLRRPGVTGPLEEYEAGFAALLGQQGYVRPAVGHQLGLMVEVSAWLAAASPEVADLTSAAAAQFGAERLVAGQSQRRPMSDLFAFRNAFDRVLSAYRERHVRPVRVGAGEARLRCLVGRERRYKPAVKSDGAQRESDGVVVPLMAGMNAAGGNEPEFGQELSVRRRPPEPAAWCYNHLLARGQ